MARILAFAGSVRSGSYNRRLLALGIEAAEAAGASVRAVDLRAHALPLYDAGLEAREGVPAEAARLARWLQESDGLLLACPEYNASFTPLLKNTLDWMSRSGPEAPGLAAFRGRVAGLLAASPGRLGGLRGLVHVRQVLTTLGMVVAPGELAVARAGDAFDEGGRLRDEHTAGALARVVGDLVRLVDRVRGGDGRDPPPVA